MIIARGLIYPMSGVGGGGEGGRGLVPLPPSPLFTTVHQHEVTEKREVSKQWGGEISVKGK